MLDLGSSGLVFLFRALRSVQKVVVFSKGFNLRFCFKTRVYGVWFFVSGFRVG